MDSILKDRYGREQEATLKGLDKHFPLYEGLNTIGRSKEATVNIKSLSVSQHHAVITCKDHTHYIGDLNSCNGTIMNNLKLMPFLLYELTDDTELKFGDFVLNFTTEKQLFQKNGHHSSFGNMTQNLTQTFYNSDTQVLDGGDFNISKTLHKDKFNEFEIHEAPTQVVNLNELQLSSTKKKSSIYMLKNRSPKPTDSEDNIHDDLTQIVNLEELELTSNLKAKSCEKDIHDAARQVVNLDKLRAASSSNLGNTNIDNIHEAETQLINLKECHLPSTSKLARENCKNDIAGMQVIGVKGSNTTTSSKIKNKSQGDTQTEIISLKSSDCSSRIANLNDNYIHDAPTEVVSLRELDDSPISHSNLHDAPPQVVNLQGLHDPGTSKSNLDMDFYEAATQVTDITDYTINENYEEVHNLPKIDKSLDIHELETQVVQLPHKFCSLVGEKRNEMSSPQPKLNEDKGHANLAPQITENIADEFLSQSQNKDIGGVSSSVETRISSDSEVRFICKTNANGVIETVNESSNDSVDLLFDEISKKNNIDEKKLNKLSKSTESLKDAPLLQNSDEETDIEENLIPNNQEVSTRLKPGLSDDSDTDIEVENPKFRKNVSIKNKFQKSNDKSESVNNKSSIIVEKQDKSTESSPLVLTKRKSKGLIIETSDSETDIEDNNTSLKLKRKPNDMLTIDSDDSDDDIIRVKRKSLNILCTQEEEESEKENVGRYSNQKNDTTIPNTPNRLNDTENLDETDCIPATQDFNTSVQSLQRKFQTVAEFEMSSEKHSQTDNLNDTDCIPATQEIPITSNTEKISNHIKVNLDENSNDSSESFKLGLTEMMISQNKNSEGFAGFPKPSTSKAPQYDEEIVLHDKVECLSRKITKKSKNTKHATNEIDKDIYLEPTQKLSEPLEKDKIDKDLVLKENILLEPDAYSAPTQKLDDINEVLMDKMVSDDEDDVGKSFNLQLTDKSDSDVNGMATRKLMLNDMSGANEKDEDFYAQATQKINDVDDNNDTVSDIYLQPTQDMNFKIPVSSSVVNKSPNDTAGEDIYLQPTQKLKNASGINKYLSDTTSEDIYLQPTQQLDSKDKLNINEKQNITVEDIYLQPTQKMSNSFHDNDVYERETQPVKQDSIFMQSNMVSEPKAKCNGKKKFTFKKNTLSMDSSLSETLPSVVSDGIFDIATEKATGDVINDRVETMSQITAFVNNIVQNVNEKECLPENIENNQKKEKYVSEKGTSLNCDKTDDQTEIRKESTIHDVKTNEENLFDLRTTQELPKTLADHDSVESMSQIAAFVNSSSVAAEKKPKDKKSKAMSIICIQENPKTSNVKTRESDVEEKENKSETAKKTKNIAEYTLEGIQGINLKINKTDGSSTHANKRSSAEKYLPKTSASSGKYSSPENKKDDRTQRRYKQRKGESLLPAIDEDGAPTNLAESLTKTTINAQQRTPSRSSKRKRSSSVASEKDMEVTIVPNEVEAAGRSTRKNQSARVAEENGEITSNPRTPSRSSRKKTFASVTSEEKEIAAGSDQKTASRSKKKRLTSSAVEEDEVIKIPVVRKTRSESITSEDANTSKVQASFQEVDRNEGSISNLSSATRNQKTSVSKDNTNQTVCDNDSIRLEINQSFALLEAKTTRTRKTKNQEDDIQVKVPKRVRAQRRNKDNTEASTSHKRNNMQKSEDDLSFPSTSTSTPKKRRLISNETANQDEIQIKIPKRVRAQKETKDSVIARASTSKESKKIKEESEDELSCAGSSTCSTPKRQRSKANETFISPERSKRKQRPKVVFTMLDNPKLESMIRQLGGSIVDSVDSCTVLVTQAVKRSQKLLQAVGQSKPICCPKWIEDSTKAHEFLDPWDYILIDKEAEEKWKFSLKDSLNRSSCRKLLQDFTFQLVVTKATDVLKGAIESCGGKCVARHPGKGTKNFFIICTPEDKAKCSRILKQHPEVIVIHPEAIFDGVLRQQLQFEGHIVTLS